ncbi:ABC transporter permease [Luedemannella flava]|uniref:Transport permease protein n=1 Tax=Luedemannella flava TaxID=349316 RepID=A0ABP4XI02_9ACTN
MRETAVAPEPGDLHDLATRFGLRPAGVRPRLTDYARQVWEYRHFTTSHANAKTISTLGGTRLGQLWQVLTPLANAAVYYLIFGIVLGTRGDVGNFLAYLCTGVFVFAFTQSVVQQATQAVSGNLGLIRSLRFPRACLPLSVVLTQVKALAGAMIVLIGIIRLTGEPPRVGWLLALPALALQCVFSAGLAMVMARLGAALPDLKQVVPFITRAWMYGSGVLYATSAFDAHLPPGLAAAAHANPMLVYIELVRGALLTGVPLASPGWQLWLLAAGWALVAGVGGLVYFWHGERSYGRG